MVKQECIHNARTRYTHGFHCRDCNTFFGKDSPTYRSDELLDTIFCTLHNENCRIKNSGGETPKDIIAMLEEIGIGKKHENYEDVIARSVAIMHKHGLNTNDSIMVLK